MRDVSIKDIVKDNTVEFHSLTASTAQYMVHCPNGKTMVFPVPLNDIGTATLFKEDKAILFMRWIRKALNDNTYVEVNTSNIKE